jgi:hypothetical protein
MVILQNQKRACDLLNVSDKVKVLELLKGRMSLVEIG